MSRFIAAAGLLAAPALMLAAAAPAEAKIVCVKGYQIVSGSPIATPYCQDTLVAQVAREYGYKVSDAAVLNNPEHEAQCLPVRRPRHSPDDRLRRRQQPGPPLLKSRKACDAPGRNNAPAR